MPFIRFLLKGKIDFFDEYKKFLITNNITNPKVKTKCYLAKMEYHLQEKQKYLNSTYNKICDIFKENTPSFKSFIYTYLFVESRNFGGNKSRKLAPMIDLCNHSNNPNVEYGEAVDIKMFMLRAKKNIKAGEELRFNYGLKNPIDFYLFHGFIPEEDKMNKTDNQLPSSTKKQNRNSLCLCGSNKKYKYCCWLTNIF